MICPCLNSQQTCDYCYYNYSGKPTTDESLNQIKQTQETISGYSNYSRQSSSIGGTSQHNAFGKNLFPSYNSVLQNMPSYIKQKGNQSDLLSPAFSQPSGNGNNSVDSPFWKPVPSQRYPQATTKFQEYFPMSPAMSMHSMDSFHETRLTPSPFIDYELASEEPTSSSSSSTVDLLLYQEDNPLVHRSQQQQEHQPSKEYSRLLYHHPYQNYQNSQQQYYKNNFASYNDQQQKLGLLQHENLLAVCVPKTFKEYTPRQSQTIPSSSLVNFNVNNTSGSLLIVNDTGFSENFQEGGKDFSGGGGGKFKKEPAQLQCPTCFKMFKRPYNLKSHQNSHSKEKPFACSYEGCVWKFTRAHDLKRHKQCKHTDIRPHKCNCGRRFARSDALKRHLTVNPVCFQAKK